MPSQQLFFLIYYISKMGNQTHSYAEDFYNRYKFIEFVSDPNFGPIKVYRKTKMNFDYVMILDKYFEKQEIQRLENTINRIIDSYSEDSQSLLLKIHNYQIFRSESTNCNLPHMKIYIEYLNYSLHQFMEQCLKKRQSLSYQEILYVLNSVIEVYQFCIGFDYNFFNGCSRAIFLTPDGYLKFIPLRVKDFYQENNAFCNALCSNAQKQTINYDKNHKNFISQFKKLFNEMLEINNHVSKVSLSGIGFQDCQAIKKMEYNVSSVRNFQQLKKLIPRSQVDALLIRRKSQTSSQIGMMPVDLGQVSEAGNLKLPVKKSMKNIKQPTSDSCFRNLTQIYWHHSNL